MQGIMRHFRATTIEGFGGKALVEVLDYAPGLDGLPKADILKFKLADNCSVVVRPSGTEPKLKTYISVSAKSRQEAQAVEAKIVDELNTYFK